MTPLAPAARRNSGLVARAASSALCAAVMVAFAVGGAAVAGVSPRVEMSDSMAPVVRAGDVVWVKTISAAAAREGDVVAFADPDRGEVVMHRVTSVRERGDRLAFVTRGDANSGVDRWSIRRDGTIGRYAGVRVPAVGRAARAVQGPPLAVIALFSGLALAMIVVRRIWR